MTKSSHLTLLLLAYRLTQAGFAMNRDSFFKGSCPVSYRGRNTIFNTLITLVI